MSFLFAFSRIAKARALWYTIVYTVSGKEQADDYLNQ